MLAPVRRRTDFDALARSRARGRSGPLWVVRAEPGADDDAGTRRVAYAVPKAVGTAVARNRIRRRIRPMIADLVRTDALPPGRYLVGVRPGAPALAGPELARHLARAARAATTAKADR